MLRLRVVIGLLHWLSPPAPVLFDLVVPAPSVQEAKHVGDEKNQQYRSQPYARPAARTPSGVAVVPSTEAENQY